MSLEILGNLVVSAVNLIVGCRLLVLGFGRRARPELLLGAALSFEGLEWAFWLLGVYTPLADTQLGGWLVVACRTGIFISNTFLLFFVRTVFRPDSTWARGLAAIVTLTIATGLFVGTYLGDQMGFASGRIWIWLELGGSGAVFGWCLVEAACHYLKMRRRVPLGLTDPVTANRMLLWTFYGGCCVTSQSTYMVATAVAGAQGSYPFIFDAIMSATSTTASIMIWLAFFPPLGYLRFVARKRQPEAA